MTIFSSTVTILAVENEDRKSKRTGNDYKHFAARCILLDDDGQPVTVGALRTRDESLQKLCQPGTFRATFALQVPDYGDNKGDIVAVLTKLTPAPTKPIAPASKPAPAMA